MENPLLEIADALDALARQQPELAARQAPFAAPFRERRAHVRLRPFDLPGPVEARLKHGPPMRLLDVSPGGALLETDTRLTPGAHLLLEFSAPGAQRAAAVPSRVTRSEVMGFVAEGGLRYRGGFAFKQLLPLNEVATPEEADFPLEDAPALADAISGLRTVAIASRDNQVARLLSEIVRQARVSTSIRSLMDFVEDRLRRYVPLLSVAFDAKPRTRAAAVDALRFELGGTDDHSARVHVEFTPACRLDDAQVRLLHAGASVMSLLYSWHRAPFATR